MVLTSDHDSSWSWKFFGHVINWRYYISVMVTPHTQRRAGGCGWEERLFDIFLFFLLPDPGNWWKINGCVDPQCFFLSWTSSHFPLKANKALISFKNVTLKRVDPQDVGLNYKGLHFQTTLTQSRAILMINLLYPTHTYSVEMENIFVGSSVYLCRVPSQVELPADSYV